MHHENSKPVAAISFINAEDLAEKLLEIRENQYLRAAVLFLDFEKTENIKFTSDLLEMIKNFPVPLIAAVTGNLPENAFLLIEASHLSIAAESSNASEAFEKGLINKIVSPVKVEREAFNLAEKICQLAPLAIRACLKSVNQGFEMSLADGLNLESELFAEIFATEDMREGTRAFLEKRSPVFRGK